MQHAKKAITSAIKLATLQQNGRAVAGHRLHDACQSAVVIETDG